MPISLTVTDRTIRNVTAGTAEANADNGDLKGSIGAEYELTARLAIGGTDNNGDPITDWAGARIYFNPAMWVDEGYQWPAGAPPVPGYCFIFPAALDGGPYPMALVGTPIAPAETNATCELVEDSGDMVLTFRFRLTADLRRYIGGSTPSALNSSRLSRSAMSAPAPWLNTVTSVYRSGSRSMLRYIIHASRLDAGAARYDYAVGFSARWYNNNRAGTGPAELGAYALTEVVRGGDIITDYTVSAWEPTTVRLQIPKNGAWDADTVCETIWVKTDNLSNLGGTYLEDYGQDFQAGTVTDTGTHWQIERIIQPDEVVFGANRYRLLAVVRVIQVAAPTNIITNSFYSVELKAMAYPTPIALTATGEIRDYDRAPGTDYVRSTVVDHVKATVVLPKGDYNAIAGTVGGGGCIGGLLIEGAGVPAVNGEYCPDEVGFGGLGPSWTKVGGIYGEDTIYIEAFASGAWVMTSGTLFLSDSAAAKYYNFSGPEGPWLVYEPGFVPPGGGIAPAPTATPLNGPGAPWAVNFDRDFVRIRLDLVDTATSDIVHTRSWYKQWVSPGVFQWVGLGGDNAKNIVYTEPDADTAKVEIEIANAFLNTAGLPDFGGTTIQFEWTFEFDYPSLPWTVAYRYTQAMQVQDFQGFADAIESIEFFSYSTGLPLLSLCDDDVVLVRVKLTDAAVAASEWHLRVYWNLEGYGYPAQTNLRPFDGVKEEEGYASPSGAFGTLLDANLIDVPDTFTAGIALFRFNHADIPQGEKPRLYVIAQPIEES